MPRIVLNRNKHKMLDGEALYYTYWHEMGEQRSIRKLSKRLNSLGIHNKDTARVPTDMAIWFAMWRWAGNNSDEAYKIFNDAMRDEGQYYTQEEWDTFLQEKMWLVFKKDVRLFDRWLKANKKKNLILEFTGSLDTVA